MASRYPEIQDARRLAELGLRPLWLCPPGLPLVGSGKHPIETGWESSCWLRPDEIRPPPFPGCNLGALLGLVPGAPASFVGVNADSPTVVEHVEGLCGKTPLRVGTARGQILLYRHPVSPVPLGSRLADVPLAVLGEGCQVVVAPSVHESGHVYTEPTTWSPLVVSGAPVFSLDLLSGTGDGEREAKIREILARVRVTGPFASWFGCMVETLSPDSVLEVRTVMPAAEVAAYDLGVQCADSGAKMSRPQDVSRSDAQSLRAAIACLHTQPDDRDDYQITRLVRRQFPRSDRARFDITVSCGSREMTVSGLTGQEINNYLIMQGRICEGSMVLPRPNKHSTPLWEKKFNAAMVAVEDVMESVDSTPVSAAVEVLRDLLRSAQDGETEEDIARGMVVRTDLEVYANPKWATHHLRTALQQDKLARDDVLTAARELGMEEKRPLLKCGGRPRVWSFLEDRLR